MKIGIETREPAEPIRKKLLYEDHIFTGAAASTPSGSCPPSH